MACAYKPAQEASLIPNANFGRLQTGEGGDLLDRLRH